MAGNATRFSQFPNGVSALKKHLHHTQPMGMSQCLEAFRRFGHSWQGRQARESSGFGLRCHFNPPTLYSNISEGYDLSISFSLAAAELGNLFELAVPVTIAMISSMVGVRSGSFFHSSSWAGRQ